MNHPFFQEYPEAAFAEHEGHRIPLQLTAPEAVTDWAKLFFPFPLPVIEVTGADRTSFLNGLGPTDLREFSSGQNARVLFTNAHGHVIFDTYGLAFDSKLWLVCDPGEEKKLLKHLEFNAITEKVEFCLLDQPQDIAFVFGLVTPPKHCRVLEHKAGYQVFWAQRDLYPALVQLGFQPIGMGLFEELRPLHDIARAGIDFGAGQLPQEAGLERYMSFQKGCYLGQEPISRVAFRGRLQSRLEQLCSLEPLVPGSDIICEGKKVGHVTSVSHLKGEKGYHALGYLKTKLAGETALELTAEGIPLKVPRYQSDPD